ncbi:hypothetical protein PGIGA_G00250830 [Pangasianodon gigas]|uniref:Uncharacterized protein n=1 Tax=Pangasianodon gigas TaxID=30993 RepID=A0ACC5WSW9_PANGG|nr:hypothetical protein [Pangasianodon gigas]
MKLCVILVLSAILPANASFVYTFTGLSGCSDSVEESEFFIDMNQNEILYEDFKIKQQINRLPPFVGQIDIPDLYETAVDDRERCLLNIEKTRSLVGSPPEARDPPEISVYPKRDVVPGEKNKFICFVKYFYPPHIRVNWTRNVVASGTI